MTKRCHQCGEKIEEYLNFCSWECNVQNAKAQGGKVHCPNGLPIKCIKHDYTMLECEHGDHPDYKFPVTVIGSEEKEQHALVFADDMVALTIHECCHYLWYLRNGGVLYKPKWRIKDVQLKLSDKALAKIKAYSKNRGNEV